MSFSATHPTILLDIDGVLAGFAEGALRLFNTEKPPTDVLDWWGIPAVVTEHQPTRLDQLDWSARARLHAWDNTSMNGVLRATDQLHLLGLRVAAPQTITDDTLWRAIAHVGAQFWEELPKLPWFDQLLELIEGMVPRENVYLVSTPTDHPSSWAGKVAWVKKHMPGYLPRLWLGHEKHMLAGVGRVLIDDGPHNLEAFVVGLTAKWSMPWNSPRGETAYDDDRPSLSVVEAAIAESQALIDLVYSVARDLADLRGRTPAGGG